MWRISKGTEARLPSFPRQRVGFAENSQTTGLERRRRGHEFLYYDEKNTRSAVLRKSHRRSFSGKKSSRSRIRAIESR